jgi:hypothetical protein
MLGPTHRLIARRVEPLGRRLERRNRQRDVLRLRRPISDDIDDAQARLLRDNVVVYEGKIGSLRRFKDDVSEVKSGFECGIGFEKFNDIKVGDAIEVFVMERVAVTA